MIWELGSVEKKLSFRGGNTQIAKGVAVLLLLWHHLLFGKLSESPVPSGFGVLMAFYGKVCVAIFLVLSGYGLWMSYNKKRPNYYKFMTTKIPGLMMPYWICFVVFGILGAAFFNRGIEFLYGGSILRMLKEFAGFGQYFNQYFYQFSGDGTMNHAWWFISLILLFYALFPAMFEMLEKLPTVFISLTFAAVMWKNTYFVVDWIFPFCIGMVIAKYDLFVKVKEWKNLGTRLVIEVALLAGVMYLRYLMTMQTVYSVYKTDGFMAILIIQIMFELFEYLGPCNKVLEFLGKHSYNIYLTHSFIMSYFFWDFVYSLPSIAGYFVVLFGSIICSFVVNFINSGIDKITVKKKTA